MVGGLGSLLLQLEGLLSRKAAGTGSQGHLPCKGWSDDNGYTLPMALGTEQLSFQQTLMRHSLVPPGRHRTVLDKLFKLEEFTHKPERQGHFCVVLLLIYAFIAHSPLPPLPFKKHA